MYQESNIKLLPQEQIGSSSFNGQLVMTIGFREAFGDIAPVVAIRTLLMILQERVMKTGADYLQVCQYKGTTFWVIDDITHITYLLPEEY